MDATQRNAIIQGRVRGDCVRCWEASLGLALPVPVPVLCWKGIRSARYTVRWGLPLPFRLGNNKQSVWCVCLCALNHIALVSSRSLWTCRGDLPKLFRRRRRREGLALSLSLSLWLRCLSPRASKTARFTRPACHRIRHNVRGAMRRRLSPLQTMSGYCEGHLIYTASY